MQEAIHSSGRELMLCSMQAVNEDGRLAWTQITVQRKFSPYLPNTCYLRVTTAAGQVWAYPWAPGIGSMRSAVRQLSSSQNCKSIVLACAISGIMQVRVQHRGGWRCNIACPPDILA